MNGGTITGLRGQSPSNADDQLVGPEEVQHWLGEAIPDTEPLPRPWIARTLAAIAVVAWVGAMLFWTGRTLVRLDPVGLVSFVAALCVPPMLAGILWLLLRRGSVAEARRFTATAQAMRSEALALERVVATVRRSLAESRMDLAEQTGSLMHLGEGATDRLRGVRAGIAEQVGAIEATAAALTCAADTAAHRLDTVLQTLPRARAETESIAQRLETTGLAASERVAALDAALAALAQRGREADEIAGGAAQRLAAHIVRMEATSDSAGARLESVIATTSGAIDGILERAADAIDESRRAITAQGDATIAMIEANGSAIERAGREGAEQLADRMGRIDDAIHVLANRIEERRRDSEALLAMLQTGIGAFDERFAAMQADGVARADAVSDAMAERLEERRRDGEAMLAAIGMALDGLDARFDAMRAAATVRVQAVADAIETRLTERRRDGTALLEMLDSGLDDFDRRFETMRADGIDRVQSIATTIDARLADCRRDGEALLATLDHGLIGFDARFDAMRETGIDRVQAVTGSIEVLTQVADALTASLDGNDATARRVIATAEDVLTALDATAREMDETLPGALDRLDARVTASREIVARSKPELLALVTAAESTHEAIGSIAEVIDMQRETLSGVQRTLLDTLAEGRQRIGEVRGIADDAIATATRFADDTAPRLSEAMAGIRETAETASADARLALARMLPEVARDLEAQGTQALAGAVDRAVATQVAELSTVAQRAVASATDAAERLTRQMLAISAAGDQLDTRMAAARAEREGAESEQFSRRVATLIDAMHSASIDITRSLSTDVSDTAWAAYLKGDRGVFTRRAVRLLDGTEARQIATLYDGDATFRDQVNRYIHDFEAMLRQILALRDGSPMGVTLLSSDMGKLYVVLAQAIERLGN